MPKSHQGNGGLYLDDLHVGQRFDSGSHAIDVGQKAVTPQRGHPACREQPQVFNRTVLDFIGKH